MSKGLNSLHIMITYLSGNYARSRESLEDFRNIENELKALEIIKETRVDTSLIKLSKDYDDYCSLEVIKVLSNGEDMLIKQRGITQQEYDLLKEVL